MSVVEVLARESAAACLGSAGGGMLAALLDPTRAGSLANGLHVIDVAAKFIETGRHLVSVGTAMLASTKRRLPMREPSIPSGRKRPEASRRSGARNVGNAGRARSEASKVPSASTRRQYDAHWRRYVQWLWRVRWRPR